METLKSLKPYPARLPKDFKKAVAMLTRPYIPITEEYYNHLLAQLDREKCNCFIMENGHIVTVGTADGGYAIMPLRPQEELKIRGKNNDRT